ncbi:MAG TPA: thiamine pyrophosphate-binding protein [Nitrososphaeraceae archaeon]|nr:thiamine pyrophosphate-binding protein [Nitrososphaeraceae archaeon]
MTQLKQEVGSLLIQRLYDYGVRHIFGVPGDYVLGFYRQLVQSNKLEIINTCDEQGAGFAADAYARINGLGVVCVTYCVGGLKVVNATAQAFAEKSPLVIISGAPGIKERRKNPLLHHKTKEFETQLKVFEHVTVDTVILDDPRTAIKDIERVLSSARRYSRPVYIELPRDMLSALIPTSVLYEDIQGADRTGDKLEAEYYETNRSSMKEALAEATTMINWSRQPVLVAGLEIQRFSLQDRLLQLIDKTNIPVVSTVLSKSTLSEDHPCYLGVYEGAMGRQVVREYVESSDCLILLGAMMTDINFAMSPTPIEQSRCIYISSEKLSIKHHNFENIFLNDFLSNLLEAPLRKRIVVNLEKQDMKSRHFIAKKNQKITVTRLFECLNSAITDNTIVITDVGDSLYGALDLIIHQQTEFLSPAYYLSVGFAVPAAIGAQLANSNLRPLVIVGDGAFQMTGMEVSTIARFNLNPIIVILNNKGYLTERVMLDGPFNDILPWNYSQIPMILNNHGKGFIVETEEQLEESLNAAINRYDNEFCILDVRLEVHDASFALQRLGKLSAEKV